VTGLLFRKACSQGWCVMQRCSLKQCLQVQAILQVSDSDQAGFLSNLCPFAGCIATLRDLCVHELYTVQPHCATLAACKFAALARS
jgi:hypothetical protein